MSGRRKEKLFLAGFDHGFSGATVFGIIGASRPPSLPAIKAKEVFNLHIVGAPIVPRMIVGSLISHSGWSAEIRQQEACRSIGGN